MGIGMGGRVCAEVKSKKVKGKTVESAFGGAVFVRMRKGLHALPTRNQGESDHFLRI